MYPNITEEDLINLRKLAEQEKNQRAPKIKNRIFKQTRDSRIAENLSPIIKKIDTMNESTKKFGEYIKDSNSENDQEIVSVEIESEDENIQTNSRAFPNSSFFSDLMTKTLGRLMSSPNSLKIKPSSSAATFLGVPV